jgi:hypothetical protein
VRPSVAARVQAAVELQRADLLEQAGGLQLVQHMRGRLFVEIEQRDRLPVPRRPAEGEVGDVHAVLAHGLAQRADDARHVGVGGVEHVLADLGVDVDALDLDEARLAVGEHGARDGPLLCSVFTTSLDVAVEDAGLVLRGGGELDAAFLAR